MTTVYDEEPVLKGDKIIGKQVGEIEKLCGIEVTHLGREMSFQHLEIPKKETIIQEGYYIQVKGNGPNNRAFFEMKYDSKF